MRLDVLKKYILTGREIEFSYCGEMYSITYTFDDNRQIINFCHFYHSSVDYGSFEELIDSATVDGKYLREVLAQIDGIVVY